MPIRTHRWTAALVSGLRRLRPRPGPEDQSWFYHPEMQARIAEAMEDIREGRVHRFDTREELFAFLDSLKQRDA